MKKPTLYIVIPCYNEESVLPITGPLFSDKLSELEEAELIAEDSRILFVNDGSGDRTWELIRAMAAADPRLIGISQSRNRGHQNSLLAGLMYAKDRCDITISIDCDGQDDLNAMNEMVKAWHDGCEVVYGVRSSRQTDSFFKRFTAEAFYRLLNRMGVEVIFNHADYRLLSSRVLAALERFEEVNIFLRGMIPLVGFCSTSVYYERHERLAGESHYPLAKMAALAINGITSLSIRPIRFITGFGLLVAAMSFVGVVWSVTQVFLGHTVPGWGSTVSILCFFSGIQLLAVGIIGEYVGKIYLETKRRPRYIISETTEEGKTEQL
ncbi:MAG: glycosyltransferase family 2 protein [Clostridium sp.]|nr:glycosyltransferase family 2 protein [Clostridium sp.]